MTQSDPDYNVGYGKPPIATRFTKGRSGNPVGRPRGKKNMNSILSSALAVKVVVNEGGKRLHKTKLEVAITQLVNKAAAGDHKALKQINEMMRLIDGGPNQEVVTPDLLNDRAQAKKIFARLAGQSLPDNATPIGDEHENQ